MKKNEKGITLIQVVIAVVMLTLIASFAVLNSNDTAVETRIAKAYNEIIEVKKAVIELKMLDEDELKMVLSGDKIDSLDEYPNLASYNKPDQEYYVLKFENEDKKDILLDTLELRNIENNYIVNIKDIENIEVFFEKGVRVRNEVFYSDDEIIEKYKNIFAEE